MAPLPVCFLFTRAQRPEFPILSMPFRQRCTPRQVAVITPMGRAVRLVRDPHPDAGTAGRPVGGSGQQDRCGVSWEANLGDRSLVHGRSRLYTYMNVVAGRKLTGNGSEHRQDELALRSGSARAI
jgi:hypothetical protein